MRFLSFDARMSFAFAGVVVALFVIAIASVGSSIISADTKDSIYKSSNYDPDCEDFGTSPASGQTFCQADGSGHNYYIGSDILSGAAGRINNFMDDLGDDTDMTTLEHTTPILSGSGETDVIFVYSTQIPGSNAGWTWCDDSTSTTVCDQHYAAFDSTNPNDDLICHEAGHTVGLLHALMSDPTYLETTTHLGCMAAGTGIGTHNIGEINGLY